MKIHPTTGQAASKSAGAIRSGGVTGKVGSFGYTRVDASGNPKMHKGTDFLCQVGHPITASLDGTVTHFCGESVPTSGRQDGRKGYGYRVYIKHAPTGDGKKVETRYAHLGVIFVKPDQKVRAGEIIGLAGRSGNVDEDVPTHLHFEVRINSNPFNPEEWLK